MARESICLCLFLFLSLSFFLSFSEGYNIVSRRTSYEEVTSKPKGDPHQIPPLCVTESQPFLGSHLVLASCDDKSVAASQHFSFIGGKFVLVSNKSICLAVGKDVDPDSDTPALELQVCNVKAANQIFRYNQTTHQITQNTTQCVDLDSDDGRLEMYDCNDPESTNQEWYLNQTQIRSAADGSCVTACHVVQPGVAGAVTSVKVNSSASPVEFLLKVGQNSSLKLKVYSDRVFRVGFAPFGEVSDPTNGEILVTPFPLVPPKVSWHQDPTTLHIYTAELEIRIQMAPHLMFSVYRLADNGLVWSEKKPLSWNTTSTWQTLQPNTSASSSSITEHFYGGGMQCGYFSHRNTKVLIQEGGGWAAGGRPNPVPFYMSSAGYGVFRNTYSPGQYDFLDLVETRHDEYRFDAFYFHGSLKEILDQYTSITGRPFMPPVWGLHLGDSDCYNSKGRNTTDVIKVADQYRAHDMPGGWLIPDDGYGCGYTQLPYVVSELHKRGFQTALWTSTGLGNATWEIGTAGSRGIKTDVAWVGDGYKFGLDAVKLATALIEGYSPSRRFTWTVCGWAGTHHHAIMWNGDNSGSWEYIRFQIPTVLGSSLSAQAHTSGDIDGIFDGSAQTYVRDMQWKCFLTVFMSMSGWAKANKQPWVYGEPYTSINRRYLKLKMQLTPYQYTYTAVANMTGVPPTRPLVLEFPDDPAVYGTLTQYQFMSGEWMMVAPVYTNQSVRNDIYLPKAEWIDYWNNKRVPISRTPTTISNYPVPLDTIPVFIRAGAIIPMWPPMNYFNEKPVDPMTLDLFPPQSFKDQFSFSLYEDDGTTRAHSNGAFAIQNITMNVDEDITVQVGASVGTFTGKQTTRSYVLQVHWPYPPSSVELDGEGLQRCSTQQQFDAATTGYFYNQQYVTFIKVGSQSLSEAFTVKFILAEKKLSGSKRKNVISVEN